MNEYFIPNFLSSARWYLVFDIFLENSISRASFYKFNDK